MKPTIYTDTDDVDRMAISQQLLELKTSIKDWHLVSTPTGKTIDEISSWLETNVRDRYYWDTTDLTNSRRTVWLESQEDLAFYQMVWKDDL